MGLTLLAHASIPYTYWDHSFTQAVHLINRLPTTALPNFLSAFTALYHTIPDYKALRIFGCACFLFLRPYNPHKFQFRSNECVYLGHSPQHKGHKCLSSDGRIFILKDVLFNEYKFPFSTMFPPILSSSPQSSLFPSTIPVVESICPSPIPSSPSSHSNATASVSSSTTSFSSPVLVPQPALNIHPMQTRSKSGIFKPKALLSHAEPTSVK